MPISQDIEQVSFAAKTGLTGGHIRTQSLGTPLPLRDGAERKAKTPRLRCCRHLSTFPR